jgi:pimeloyl-ACP methyl ester carboxylesterase
MAYIWDRAEVHYLKAGTGKTLLVLIHGFGETSRMWIPKSLGHIEEIF